MKDLVSRIKTYIMTIKPEDENLVIKLKKKFEHFSREFVYGNKKYLVDSLRCHATPGLLETNIINISQKSPKGKKILNLGGGTGQISAILKQMGLEVYNLDLEIEKSDKYNVKFDLNNPQSLPYPEKFFDFILCQEVIEHIENPWLLIRNIKKVLADKGVVYLTTPNVESAKSKRLFDRHGYFHWFAPECLSYHVNPIFKFELELILHKNQMKIVDIQGSGDYYFNRGSSNVTKIIKNNESLVYTVKNI